mgnify:CR=1 FL=1
MHESSSENHDIYISSETFIRITMALYLGIVQK